MLKTAALCFTLHLLEKVGGGGGGGLQVPRLRRPCKGSRSNPDHYRPISVLSVTGRLFEKIVHQQLYDFLKESLSVTQSGFKSGCSTETSLLNTSNHWILNIDKKHLKLTPVLDLRKLSL